MFMPAEAIFSQALETDPGLIEYAAGKGVMLSTPTTLIAMLKTIAYAWNSEAVAANAAEVHRLGRDLYERLSKVSSSPRRARPLDQRFGHGVQPRDGLAGVRVLVSARRFRELHVSEEELRAPQPLVDVTRPLTAPELVATDDPLDVIEGPAGREQWTRKAVNDG